MLLNTSSPPPAHRENDALVQSKLDLVAYNILHAHKQRWWIGAPVPAPVLPLQGHRGSVSQSTGIRDQNSEENCIRVVKGRPDKQATCGFLDLSLESWPYAVASFLGTALEAQTKHERNWVSPFLPRKS